MKRLVLQSFLTMLTMICSVDSIEESYCAGTGYRDGGRKASGVRSLGWSKVDHLSQSAIWATNHANKLYNSDRILMDIRKVEEPDRGTNSELNGWLQINIKLADQSNSFKIMMLAVWALTDSRESIGEFISTKTAACKSAPTPYTDENILPCAAAPINEPVV